MELDREATFNYIDKIHGVLIETGKAVNRSFVVLIIISILILANAAGSASIGTNFELSGTALELRAWIILLGLSCLLAVNQMYFLAMSTHEQYLTGRIIELYDNLNFSEPGTEDLSTHPLEYPNLVTVAFNSRSLAPGRAGQLLYSVAKLVTMTLVYLGPPLVQIAALVKMLEIIGNVWWIWTIYVFMLIAMATYTMLNVQADLLRSK